MEGVFIYISKHCHLQPDLLRQTTTTKNMLLRIALTRFRILIINIIMPMYRAASQNHTTVSTIQ